LRRRALVIAVALGAVPRRQASSPSFHYSDGMEFVEAAHTHLISRYDPHPEVFAPKTPYSYNPTGGAKFLPKLSPQTLGSPTIEVVSRAEQTAKAKWHKGGWDAVNSPPQKRGFGDENAAAPMVMRGGWPADGVAYSRVTGAPTHNK